MSSTSPTRSPTPAQELLEKATPLPWEQGRGPIDPFNDKVRSADGLLIASTWPGPNGGETDNAALIVYAVNRLPLYEQAVAALRRLTAEFARQTAMSESAWLEARSALAALDSRRGSEGGET